MAPPKVKLHKTTGKLKSIPRPNTVSSPVVRVPAPVATANDATPSEADRQFELELYWCIQQLESSLSLPQVRENNKKTEDTTKLINTLKSGTQPIIRKRQIMRTTFGDYRSKMAAEEQTLAVDPNSIRFEEPKEKARFHFVKKSAILNGDKNFRFNFATNGNDSAPPVTIANGSDNPVEHRIADTSSNLGTIVPSDNSFRFNFAVTTE
ncbi:UPF0488 protein CG14286 [Anopheles nili]|uniref:UPF0488 protein CG14286 n=1 Tax=Anopheles nili TaxID=185578 RepID=UPI00237B358F|nr:UPF0488 protein CG14286 [Anopheles nili]